jgi:hypothetical protein
MAFLKTLPRLKQEWTKSPALGPDNQAAKTWYGLEKKKENEPNYQCLPLLTVLPLNYFMSFSQSSRLVLSPSALDLSSSRKW